MLNVGKLVVAPGVGRYYVEQVAGGREDYYAGEGEAVGYWMGSAAAALGVSGEVTEGGLTRLLAAQDPRTGVELRRPHSERAVAGYDLTVRAPKSVSIVFGIAEPAIAAEVADRPAAESSTASSGAGSPSASRSNRTSAG